MSDGRYVDIPKLDNSYKWRWLADGRAEVTLSNGEIGIVVTGEEKKRIESNYNLEFLNKSSNKDKKEENYSNAVIEWLEDKELKKKEFRNKMNEHFGA